ncbi:hypothetical protein [Rhodococcoides fascians]|uniref:hypothetical protein n=1 Tax=Rhodococcoides fascians TaxID=1828 RepID=UPI0007AAE316|nr:hypothetical protein [Rhodococcus fascians]AMY54770.1 Ribonuclease BN [Rhodococcus fascians D188]
MAKSGLWSIVYAGVGSLIGPPQRALPAILVETESVVYLIDCGDGTAERLRRLGKTAVDLVAITSIGTSELGGLITFAEINMRTRRRALRVVGPPGIEEALKSISLISPFTSSELFEITEVVAGQVLHSKSGIYLEAVPMAVGADDSAWSYLVYEAALPGRVDAAKAALLGIRGADFGALLGGNTVRGVRPRDVIGPRRPGRRVLIAGRGRETPELLDAVENCEFASFAAPFTDDRLEIAEESGYMTGWEVAELAAERNVSLTAMTRLGPFASFSYQLTEARQYNKNICAPHDYGIISVPLRERGLPIYSGTVSIK